MTMLYFTPKRLRIFVVLIQPVRFMYDHDLTCRYMRACVRIVGARRTWFEGAIGSRVLLR